MIFLRMLQFQRSYLALQRDGYHSHFPLQIAKKYWFQPSINAQSKRYIYISQENYEKNYFDSVNKLTEFLDNISITKKNQLRKEEDDKVLLRERQQQEFKKQQQRNLENKEKIMQLMKSDAKTATLTPTEIVQLVQMPNPEDKIEQPQNAKEKFMQKTEKEDKIEELQMLSSSEKEQLTMIEDKIKKEQTLSSMEAEQYTKIKHKMLREHLNKRYQLAEAALAAKPDVQNESEQKSNSDEKEEIMQMSIPQEQFETEQVFSFPKAEQIVQMTKKEFNIKSEENLSSDENEQTVQMCNEVESDQKPSCEVENVETVQMSETEGGVEKNDEKEEFIELTNEKAEELKELMNNLAEDIKQHEQKLGETKELPLFEVLNMEVFSQAYQTNPLYSEEFKTESFWPHDEKEQKPGPIGYEDVDEDLLNAKPLLTQENMLKHLKELNKKYQKDDGVMPNVDPELMTSVLEMDDSGKSATDTKGQQTASDTSKTEASKPNDDKEVK